MVAIGDVCELVVEELTNWVGYSDDEYKFSKDIIVGLMRSKLLNLAEYSMGLTKLMMQDGIQLLRKALAKPATRPGSLESSPRLVEISGDVSPNAPAPSGYMVSNGEKANQSRDRVAPPVRLSVSRGNGYNVVESMTADPFGFRDQVLMLYNEWYRTCEATGTDDAAVTRSVSQLQQSGLLK
ncbi:hypothetical protein MKW98_020345, partial [Papaver atlanticum]